MAQQHWSEQNGSHETRSQRRQPQPQKVRVSCSLILGVLPFPIFSKLAGLYAVALHVFQRNDRGSAWLAFGMVWLVCAIVALASAYLVFQVAETRKRFLGR